MPLGLLILIVAGELFAIPFLLWPNIDLAVSANFYDSARGFYLEFDPLLRGVYLFITAASRALVAAFVFVLFVQFIAMMTKSKHLVRIFSQLTPAIVVYFIVVLATGPGMGIHYVIKEEFERPRPREIVEFGGDKQFVPALHVGQEEGKSFVSGHAAMGFYLAAIALLFTGRVRVVLYSFAVAAGAFIGAIRIMQGGHFLSDIVFSGIFTLFVVHFCYWLMQPKRKRYAHLS